MAHPEDDHIEQLARVSLFGGLSKKDLSLVMRRASVVDHPAGKTIVAEGSEGAVGFHLILDGSVTVTVGGRVRRTMGPGEYFGEIALVDGGSRSATVVADTSTRTLSISAWDFRPLLNEQPSITYAILLEVCRRLRDAEAATTD